MDISMNSRVGPPQMEPTGRQMGITEILYIDTADLSISNFQGTKSRCCKRAPTSLSMHHPRVRLQYQMEKSAIWEIINLGLGRSPMGVAAI
jgi:hypothetical protein